MRMNSLQERVDLLVIKVTQLDSTVEEGEEGLVWGDVQLCSGDKTPAMLRPPLHPLSFLCPPSVTAGHQHEESLQELHGAEPAGSVSQLHPQPGDGDVPALRQTPSAQHPHTLQVRGQKGVGPYRDRALKGWGPKGTGPYRYGALQVWGCTGQGPTGMRP